MKLLYQTVHLGRKRLLLGTALALLLALGVGAAVLEDGTAMQVLMPGTGQSLPPGDTPEQRLAFLRQAGLTVQMEEERQTQVQLPKEFDQAYQRYQALQREQGFDLRPYRGKTLLRYQYPAPEEQGEGMITLLIYQGEIVGGDVFLQGEMKGFSFAEGLS